MSRSTTFSTTYAGGDEDPISEGGVWSSGYTGIGHLKIQGHGVGGTNSANDNWSSVNTPSFANNQWAQGTIAALSAGVSEFSCNLRVAAPATWTGYTFIARTGASPSSEIGVNVSGSFTSLKTDTSATWATSDQPSAEAEGTTLRMYRNGSLVTSVTDATLSSGRIAHGLYDSLGISTTGTAFSGGDLVADTPYLLVKN